MKTIILDTNFLTIPYQFGVDIFEEIDRIVTEEHEIVTLDGVIRELKHLTKEKSKDSVAAKVGLELIKKKNVKIIETQEKTVDDAIVELSTSETLVATNDKGLTQRLKGKNVKIIYLRGKNRLELY